MRGAAPGVVVWLVSDHTKICDLGDEARGEEHVLPFDVAVHAAHLGDGVEARGTLPRYTPRRRTVELFLLLAWVYRVWEG